MNGHKKKMVKMQKAHYSRVKQGSNGHAHKMLPSCYLMVHTRNHKHENANRNKLLVFFFFFFLGGGGVMHKNRTVANL